MRPHRQRFVPWRFFCACLTCPPTVWEQDLRRLAGQGSYTHSFIEHWLSRLLYWEAPWWVFLAAYTAFALLMAVAWWWVPPKGRRAE